MWITKPAIPEELKTNYLDFSSLTSQLLFNRGLTERSEINDFLLPDYNRLHDPFLFLDMQKTTDRIFEAIEKNEQITIYADYDADAVTAAAVMVRALKYLGAKVNSYIPDRFTEGYGVNPEAIKELADKGTTLIITVDCGTNSVNEAVICKDLKIDFIITDHHEVIADLPTAYAVINPKNRTDSYPYEQITGVGVAFKVVQALFSNKDKVLKLVPQHKEGWEKWLLDLVAIGTIADCHSLLGENRILVHFGLKVLQKSKWPGLANLIQLAGITNINSHSVGFSLAPRINAAGRLSHASVALNCLIEDDQVQAQNFSFQIDELNKKRQDLTQLLISQAREKAMLKGDSRVLVLSDFEWHRGLVGIAAGRLAEEFKRPVFVIGGGDNELVGSGRGRGNFNIVECLKFASSALSKFGGHKSAAGLSLKKEDIDRFDSLVQEFSFVNMSEDEEEARQLEGFIKEGDLDIARVQELNFFEPFGVDNPKPIFFIEHAKLNNIKLVGKNRQHVQARFLLGSKNVDAIAFNSAKKFAQMNILDSYNLAVELMEDNFLGFPKVKLMLHEVI